LGGVDPSYATSDFTYYPLSSASYWMVDMSDLKIDGVSIGASGLNAIIDTGTSAIVGPTAHVNKILEKFENP